MLALDITTKEQKINILEAFIDTHSNEAIQGSDQWLLDRQFIIGGSEISTIEGSNPFSSVETLVAQRIGLTTFAGNTATQFGNLFENVAELLFTTLVGEPVYATGSIPHKNISNHRYSPDGLCVLLFDINNKKEHKITLLEFKSPYGSVPTKNVPKHYLPQVKAGLCTIDIAETSIFINNMFRKCALDQLDFTINYDTAYHRDSELKLKGINMTIANGMILFYISKDNIGQFLTEFDQLINPVYDGYESDNSDDSDDFATNVINENVAFLSKDIDMNDSDTESDDGSDICDDGTSILYKLRHNVVFFQKYNEKTISKEQLKENVLSYMIDFGDINREMFDQFLTLYKPMGNKKSFIDILCVKPQINKALMQMKFEKNLVMPPALDYIREPEYLDKICKKYDFTKIISKFTDRCIKNNNIPIGYLPWKLLRSSNIIVDKEHDYLDKIKEKIDNAISIVKDIMQSESMDDRVTKFEEHFPDSNLPNAYNENKQKSAEYYKEFV